MRYFQKKTTPKTAPVTLHFKKVLPSLQIPPRPSLLAGVPDNPLPGSPSQGRGHLTAQEDWGAGPAGWVQLTRHTFPFRSVPSPGLWVAPPGLGAAPAPPNPPSCSWGVLLLGQMEPGTEGLETPLPLCHGKWPWGQAGPSAPKSLSVRTDNCWELALVGRKGLRSRAGDGQESGKGGGLPAHFGGGRVDGGRGGGPETWAAPSHVCGGSGPWLGLLSPSLSSHTSVPLSAPLAGVARP